MSAIFPITKLLPIADANVAADTSTTVCHIRCFLPHTDPLHCNTCIWSKHTNTTPLFPHQPVVKNSPALTEDTERKPSRSSSPAADKPGFAILLLLLARLHILRGPFRNIPFNGKERASRYRRERGLVVPGDEAHLNLDAAARSATTARGGGMRGEEGMEMGMWGVVFRYRVCTVCLGAGGARRPS